jgi:hypothetical protein
VHGGFYLFYPIIGLLPIFKSIFCPLVASAKPFLPLLNFVQHALLYEDDDDNDDDDDDEFSCEALVVENLIALSRYG